MDLWSCFCKLNYALFSVSKCPFSKSLSPSLQFQPDDVYPKSDLFLIFHLDKSLRLQENVRRFPVAIANEFLRDFSLVLILDTLSDS